MLRIRTKRRAATGIDAVNRLAHVEASVVALKDEDLLDLADIFKEEQSTPLMQMAMSEMARRAISL